VHTGRLSQSKKGSNHDKCFSGDRCATAAQLSALSIPPIVGAGAEEAPATAAQLATFDFEPWEELQIPPTNEQWCDAVNPHLISVRLAYNCKKSKAELVELLGQWPEDDGDGEAFTEMMQGIKAAQDYFKYFVHVLESAEARIICSGSVVEFREEAGAYA